MKTTGSKDVWIRNRRSNKAIASRSVAGGVFCTEFKTNLTIAHYYKKKSRITNRT